MIRARYDNDADVLYIALNGAQKAFVAEQPDGLLFRYAYDSRDPCGVTVLGFSSHWGKRVGVLSGRISAFLGTTSPDEVARAVSRAARQAG